MMKQQRMAVPVLLIRGVRLEGMIFHRPYAYVVFFLKIPLFIGSALRTQSMPSPDAILQLQTHATV